MSSRKPIPAGILTIYAVMLALAFAPLAIGVPIIGVTAGAVAGSVFIFVVVRRVNRRHHVHSLTAVSPRPSESGERND